MLYWAPQQIARFSSLLVCSFSEHFCLSKSAHLLQCLLAVDATGIRKGAFNAVEMQLC